jgi:hypothetical protein
MIWTGKALVVDPSEGTSRSRGKTLLWEKKKTRRNRDAGYRAKKRRVWAYLSIARGAAHNNSFLLDLLLF